MTASWTAEAGVSLDREGDVPLGVQLAWAIRAAVAAGRLHPGARLPALRDLAEELGVNHNTLRAVVAKLEREGVLESRHGTGTFVAEGAASRVPGSPVVDQVLDLAANAGVAPRDLAAALYVADAEAAEPDAEAGERRALRRDIAALDRLVVELEARLHTPRPPGAGARTAGSHLPTAAELRGQRAALLRRLADAQEAIEATPAAPATDPEPEADGPAATAAPRLPPRPRPSPA